MTGRLPALARLSPVAIAACLLVVPLAGCGGSSAVPSRVATTNAIATSASSSSPPTPPSATASQATAVSDGSGATFVVAPAPMMSSPYVDADTFLWSAAPGQEFLRDTLTVMNSSAHNESLSAFDDLTSGQSTDLAFTMSASIAASMGYGSDCAVAPAFPSSVCPISLGQGVTVDTDSANHGDRSDVTLAPGAHAQITVSYGPILGAVSPTTVAVYFDSGQGMAVDLSS